MEASLFAFLAGMSNFSSGVAQITGAIIFDWAGVETEAGKCDFAPLWWLILCFHILLPLFVSVGAAYLIPNAKQTDELMPDGSIRNSVELIGPDEMSREDAVPFIDY